jgi:hypothetical protein
MKHSRASLPGPFRYGWFTEGFDTPDLKKQGRCSANWQELAISTG